MIVYARGGPSHGSAGSTNSDGHDASGRTRHESDIGQGRVGQHPADHDTQPGAAPYEFQPQVWPTHASGKHHSEMILTLSFLGCELDVVNHCPASLRPATGGAAAGAGHERHARRRSGAGVGGAVVLRAR